MIRKISFDEDIVLKRFIQTPDEQKPRFNWREVAVDAGIDIPKVHIAAEDTEDPSEFSLEDIVETIGSALTDLLLARQSSDIFTQENKQFVLNIAREVVSLVNEYIDDRPGESLRPHEMHVIIEKALVGCSAHDVARSFVFKRSHGEVSIPLLDPVSVRLIRRNGQVVDWDQNKIEIAVRKAFLSLHMDSSPAVQVAEAVTAHVRDLHVAFINIEDAQDIVQEELMRHGHFKVAEAYIIYRAHRAHLRRESEVEDPNESIQESMIMVREENGDTFFWDGVDLRKRIEYAMIGLDLYLSKDEIEKELRRSLYAEMSRRDLKKTIILNAKSLIEKDADFGKFASRILLTYIYEEVLNWDIVNDGVENLKLSHRECFINTIKHGVQIKRLDERLLRYDLSKLADALDPTADLNFDYLGIQTLYDRYLIVDKTSKSARRIETPQIFWMRVSMGLFLLEENEPEEQIISLYKLYKSRRFCSSTPTLFNASTLRSQLSSCYLYKVDDSIESIMTRGISENAYLSKWAGGLGGSWTAVRGTGSYIEGTNGESQGLIPFLKLHNDQLIAVNQGGKRRGSGCAYLEIWHNDIFDFLELRKNVGDDRRRTHDMNTANWIPDLFMKRMENRETWTLFRSSETPDLHDLYGKAFEERYLEYEKMAEAGEIFSEKINSIDLWKRMLTMLFETGHPWITFKDPCNVRSPQDHVGVIHSSNLCTEITLNTSADETAVCNLGSVVLDMHLTPDGALDHEKLRETVRIAVRALDNVIDINFYPTEAARNSNMRHRPIGLGVMGLQVALQKKGISFASDAAVEFNDEFMEAIAYYAYEASSDLAAERGTYSTYKGSKWDRGLLPQDTLDLLESERGKTIEVPRNHKMDWLPLREKIAKQGMRNSNVLAIAPTATISNIMGTSPCIEPYYKNIYVKSNLGGDFVVLNLELVKELKSLDLWNDEVRDQLKYFDGDVSKIDGIPESIKDKYKTVFDIEYTWFIEAASRRQKWIDQSQSVNLFLGKPDMKTLSHMYRAAWSKGLKTTYYLRTLGASNIEKATVSVQKEKRGIIAETPQAAAQEKEYTAEEVKACSLDAMLNGGECEACQ